MTTLFSPFQLGPYALAHRVVMAPLTRMRAGPGEVPSSLMTTYYSQRATPGGLLISEATSVSPHGFGYAHTPGIFTREQIAGWRPVTDAVHARGGYIFLQLWHVGRQSHPDLQPGGVLPVSSSAIQAIGASATDGGPRTYPAPRALELAEIAGVVAEFRQGAAYALAAGFDGVEVHGANGYLPDQFLQDGSNTRTDIYGGSVENRARFLLEIVEAVSAVWGGDRVGVRLSPGSGYGTMSDSDPAAIFGYVAKALNAYGLAYLHLVEPRVSGNDTIDATAEPVATRSLRRVYKGPIIAAGGFNLASAEAIVTAGDADLVAFGRHFISNPDLVERLRNDKALSAYDRSSFYGGDWRGYTDYPRHLTEAAA